MGCLHIPNKSGVFGRSKGYLPVDPLACALLGKIPAYNFTLQTILVLQFTLHQRCELARWLKLLHVVVKDLACQIAKCSFKTLGSITYYMHTLDLYTQQCIVAMVSIAAKYK